MAIEYYFKGIRLARSTPGESNILAMLLNNLGSENLDVGKLSEAFTAISEGMEINYFKCIMMRISRILP